MSNDSVINKQQAEIENECIKVIATQQPVALDLREFLSDINIANKLERIADYAAAIAKIVQRMPDSNEVQDPDILLMAEKCSGHWIKLQ